MLRRPGRSGYDCGRNRKKSWTAREICAITRSRSATGFVDSLTNTEIATWPAPPGRVKIPTSFVVPPMVPVLWATIAPSGSKPLSRCSPV